VSLTQIDIAISLITIKNSFVGPEFFFFLFKGCLQSQVSQFKLSLFTLLLFEYFFFMLEKN
jgi:hypothetical protein